MSRMKSLSWFLSILILAAGALPAQTGGRLFLFPQTSGQSITVLDATTLANVGVIPSPANVSSVVGLPDGSKYYVIANNPSQTITIVSGSNLSVVRQIALGANASHAVVTPDGRRLLVTAGTLRILDTATDNEVGNVPAGSGPTEIVVTHDSTRAFVMAASGTITVVNLTNNQQVAQYPVPGPVSIALLPSDFRLLVLNSDGTLRALNPNNGNEALSINVSVSIGKVLVTPDGSRAVILNRGFAPLSSVVVDLSNNEKRDIGTGSTQFEQIVIADPTTAYGLVAGTGTINKIDLTTGIPVAQSYSPATRVLEVSPSGKNLYAVSFQNRTVLRIDVATNSQQANQTVTLPPVGASLFALPGTVAATMILNGGDRQNVLAGQTTPFPLTVKLTTTDGTPVFNQAVTFSTSKAGVTFSPAQPSRTNSRGVATAFVTVPPVASTLQPAPDDQTGTQAASAPEDGVNQFDPGVEVITISATSQNTGGVNFTLSVGTTTGLTVVSGSNQITRPSQQYALPLVVRATGTDGFPLVGASVTFFSTGGSTIAPLSRPGVITDGDGIARAQFGGGTLPPTSFSATSAVSASVDGRLDLGSVSFILTLASGLPTGMEILSGDGQEGDIGTTLSQPLCVVIGGTGAFGPRGLIGIYWQVVDGPNGVASAAVNPPISITDSGGRSCTQLTIGNRAGTQDIIVRAYMPTVPDNRDEVRFRAKAKGGPPARIDIRQGNNQEGRPGQTFPLALRVRVFDIGGNPVPLSPSSPFPLTFTVEPARAGAISNFFQQADGEASVLVTIALNYVGEFKVLALAGDGRAEFTFRSVSQPVAIVQVSGQGQNVAVGATSAQPLIARINDNLGGPVPAIPVTFSGPSTVTFVPAEGPTGNPITINSGADGRASVNVRINAGAAPGSITITASASVGNPAAVANVTFTLTVTGRTPSFTLASVVNAGSFVAGMVPGGLASLFGTGLSEVIGLELPGGATTHKGVQVKIGGQAMPLFSVSNENGREQINFQVRSDIPGPSTATVEVSNNGATFSVASVPVLRAQPGIFEYTPQGSALKYAAALKADFTVMGPNNRVPRGGAVSIFLTGMGPTLPLLPTGQAAPSNPLATTFFQPTVGIGGRGAQVLFSGLAPGFIGLYQINILIDQDAPVGEAITLDIIVEGAPSQTTRIAIQ